MNYIFKLIYLLVVFTPSLYGAENEITKFEFRDSQSIKWELYESSEPVNSFTSALELPNQSWKEVTTKDIVVPGQNDPGIWIRASFKNKLPSATSIYLNLHTLFLDRLDFYMISSKGNLEYSESYLNNFSKKHKLFLPEKTFTISLEEEEEKIVYIRIQYNFKMNLDVVVQSENEAIEEVSVPYLLKGMLLGILIILSLMTVTYAWIARQANFIALALYQFFMTLFAGKTLGISLASILIDGAWWRGSGVFINLTICLASLGGSGVIY